MNRRDFTLSGLCSFVGGLVGLCPKPKTEADESVEENPLSTDNPRVYREVYTVVIGDEQFDIDDIRNWHIAKPLINALGKLDPAPNRVEISFIQDLISGHHPSVKGEFNEMARRRGWLPTETRYIVVSGAVLPDATGLPAFFPVDHGPAGPNDYVGDGKACFAKLGSFIQDDGKVPSHVPRYSGFPVMHEVLVGTVDELVDHFRCSLEGAVRTQDNYGTMLSDAGVDWWNKDRDYQQKWLDEHYPRCGRAIRVPFNIEAMKNYKNMEERFMQHHPSMQKAES